MYLLIANLPTQDQADREQQNAQEADNVVGLVELDSTPPVRETPAQHESSTGRAGMT